MSQLFSPLRYIGSKGRLAPAILELLPPHNLWVEVFGGSAALTFAKDPQTSKGEVYNDKWSAVTTFFRMLRDKPKELQRLCELSPYSQEEHAFCRDNLNEPGISELELARRCFVNLKQSFGGKYSAGHGYAKNRAYAREYCSTIERFAACSERFRQVDIVNLDWIKLIKRYDVIGNLLYCDPPYHPSIRCSGKLYECEFNNEDHVALLKRLNRCKAMVMLSGYDNELYREMLPDWSCKRFEVAAYISNVLDDGTLPRVNECVWFNPIAQLASAGTRIIPKHYSKKQKTFSGTRCVMIKTNLIRGGKFVD